VLDGRRITGVRAWCAAVRCLSARVRGEVILAAGAVGSPLILQRSGIGDAEALNRLGIEPCAITCLGVGANLQDHLQIRPVYKVSGVRTLNTDYANLARRLGMGVDYAAAAIRASDHGPLAAGDVLPLGPRTRRRPTCSFTSSRSASTSGAMACTGSAPSPPASAICARPAEGRGRGCRDPAWPTVPLIDPRYLTTPEDRRTSPSPPCAGRGGSWPSRP
jgi:choline dehydrogenase